MIMFWAREYPAARIRMNTRSMWLDGSLMHTVNNPRSIKAQDAKTRRERREDGKEEKITERSHGGFSSLNKRLGQRRRDIERETLRDRER